RRTAPGAAMSDALISAVSKAWAEAATVTPGARAWRAVRITYPGPLTVLAAIREADRSPSILLGTADDGENVLARVHPSERGADAHKRSPVSLLAIPRNVV